VNKMLVVILVASLKHSNSQKSEGGRRGLRGRNGGSDLTNVQHKPIWNCHNESPPVQQIHLNKKKSLENKGLRQKRHNTPCAQREGVLKHTTLKMSFSHSTQAEPLLLILLNYDCI
jgi:hypothetical protein